jgi:DNA-binding MarR family transcriptional regulator
MNQDISAQIAIEILQLLSEFSRTRWEHQPSMELRPSESELLILLYLSITEEKKALSASELSSVLNITPAGVTHLINPLEELGYVQRSKAPNDRRIVLVGLTEKGQQSAEDFIQQASKMISGLVKYLGVEDSRIFVRIMSSVIEYMKGNPLNPHSS